MLNKWPYHEDLFPICSEYVVFTCGYVTKETAGGEEDACGLDFVQNAFAESQIGTLIITSNAFPFQTSSTGPAAIGRLGTPGFLKALRN